MMNVKEKILRIMALALEINPPEVYEIGQKQTAVFVRWSPHCNVLDGDIHEGGWKDDDKEPERWYIRVDDDTHDELGMLIERLEAIAREVGNADEG